MLSLVFAESSLELVPKELQNHHSVIQHSKKIGKIPSEILLDNSWHFAAMKGIKNEIKRGRPDLVHISLLSACSTPLYLQDRLAVFVHTIDDKVIFVGKQVRIPKSYHRFSGLVEQLYKDEIVSDGNKNLLKIKNMQFDQLIRQINPTHVVGLLTQGKTSTFEDVAKKLHEKSCLVIGGFQKGHFSNKIKNKINELIQVDKNSLESHVVVSRILYEYEKTIFK